MTAQPPPDPAVEPAGFVVEVAPGDRVHFLDWGGPTGAPGILLIHGLSNTAWTWAPVARRLVDRCRVVAMDLRGHGLSDAPTEGYDADGLGDDAIAVAEGSGLLAGAAGAEDAGRVVLAGHGFGAIVAVWAARRLEDRCAGVVLVDGGWEVAEDATGIDVDEFLRSLDEPPEVLRSLAAFLADRVGYDPATWDADQERAARAAVVETHAGRVVPTTRPHVREAIVRAMYAYRPRVELISLACPVVALVAGAGPREAALTEISNARVAAGHGPIPARAFPGAGHNLMRYRPDDVSAAIRSLAIGRD